MAAAKSTKAQKQSPLISTAALSHGAAADGARFVRPGFAFTAADDLAFALGYPHLTYLADGHPDDADPEAAAPLYVSKHGLAPTVWPREVAARVARAFGNWFDDAKVAEAYRTAGAITADEARQIIRSELHGNNSRILLLLLEALVGPSVVVSTAVDQLEAFSGQEWTDSGPNIRTDLPPTILSLGYLLLRLPADEAAGARARLEALYQVWTEEPKRFRTAAAKAIDVVLHGAAGAERSAYRAGGQISPYAPLHILDDPAWVARIVKASGAPDQSAKPDARLVFLGGDEVLDLELSRWKKYTKPGAHTLLVEQLGKIQSPQILPWMLEMSATSKAKGDAQAWFLAHADFARGFLEQSADAGGAPADWARVVLKKLG
jgi:hypothetical protein